MSGQSSESKASPYSLKMLRTPFLVLLGIVLFTPVENKIKQLFNISDVYWEECFSKQDKNRPVAFNGITIYNDSAEKIGKVQFTFTVQVPHEKVSLSYGQEDNQRKIYTDPNVPYVLNIDVGSKENVVQKFKRDSQSNKSTELWITRDKGLGAGGKVFILFNWRKYDEINLKSTTLMVGDNEDIYPHKKNRPKWKKNFNYIKMCIGFSIIIIALVIDLIIITLRAKNQRVQIEEKEAELTTLRDANQSLNETIEKLNSELREKEVALDHISLKGDIEDAVSRQLNKNKQPSNVESKAEQIEKLRALFDRPAEDQILTEDSEIGILITELLNETEDEEE